MVDEGGAGGVGIFPLYPLQPLAISHGCNISVRSKSTVIGTAYRRAQLRVSVFILDRGGFIIRPTLHELSGLIVHCRTRLPSGSPTNPIHSSWSGIFAMSCGARLLTALRATTAACAAPSPAKNRVLPEFTVAVRYGQHDAHRALREKREVRSGWK